MRLVQTASLFIFIISLNLVLSAPAKEKNSKCKGLVISPSEQSCLLGHMLEVLTQLINNQKQPICLKNIQAKRNTKDLSVDTSDDSEQFGNSETENPQEAEELGNIKESRPDKNSRISDNKSASKNETTTESLDNTTQSLGSKDNDSGTYSDLKLQSSTLSYGTTTDSSGTKVVTELTIKNPTTNLPDLFITNPIFTKITNTNPRPSKEDHISTTDKSDITELTTLSTSQSTESSETTTKSTNTNSIKATKSELTTTTDSSQVTELSESTTKEFPETTEIITTTPSQITEQLSSIFCKPSEITQFFELTTTDSPKVTKITQTTPLQITLSAEPEETTEFTRSIPVHNTYVPSLAFTNTEIAQAITTDISETTTIVSSTSNPSKTTPFAESNSTNLPSTIQQLDLTTNFPETTKLEQSVTTDLSEFKSTNLPSSSSTDFLLTTEAYTGKDLCTEEYSDNKESHSLKYSEGGEIIPDLGSLDIYFMPIIKINKAKLLSATQFIEYLKKLLLFSNKEKEQ